MIRYGPQMRILVVGGGIAGLTLAALLRRRGAQGVHVVEKAAQYGGVGYVLGLWPAGGNILKALDLFEPMLERSIPVNSYQAFDWRGGTLVDASFAGADPRIADARLIARADLLDVLREAIDTPVRFETTVDQIHQDGEGVEVHFSDGTPGRYDCVIGADGVRSRIRELIFGEMPLQYSGLSGWAFWTPPRSGAMREYYGDGCFAGFYPTRAAECCFAAVAAPPGASSDAHSLAEIRERFEGMPDAVRQAFDEADPQQAVWRDDFDDVRLPRWSTGRVSLLGDSAAAMLPTAGVGASMAMESAAVLAQELAMSDSRLVSYALARYERRRRKRVDRVQSQSRWLAWAVRARGPFAPVRDSAFRMTTPKMFLGAFSTVLFSAV